MLRRPVLALLLVACVASTAGCAATPVRPTVRSGGIAAMRGTWVVTTSDQELRREGVSDFGLVANTAGTSLITFTATGFTSVAIPQATYTPEEAGGTGRISERKGVVTIHWSEEPGEHVSVVPYRTSGGRLAFADRHSAEQDPDERALDKALLEGAAPWPALQDAIQGSWTTSLAVDDLRASGVAESTAKRLAGTQTLRLKGGRWTLGRAGSSTSGTYRLQGPRIVLTWGPAASATTTAVVGPNVEGGLTFLDPAEGSGRSGSDKGYDLAAFATAWKKA